MDFSKIKNLVKANGDKFIFLENGEPEAVLMSFKEYEKLIGASTGQIRQNFPQQKFSEEVPDVDSDAPKDTELIPNAFSESIGLPVRLEDIRLEDLPI